MLVIPSPVLTCDDGSEPEAPERPSPRGAAPQPDLRPRTGDATPSPTASGRCGTERAPVPGPEPTSRTQAPAECRRTCGRSRTSRRYARRSGLRRRRRPASTPGRSIRSSVCRRAADRGRGRDRPVHARRSSAGRSSPVAPARDTQHAREEATTKASCSSVVRPARRTP